MPKFLFIGGKSPGSLALTTPGAGSFTVPYFAESFRVRAWGPGCCGNGWSSFGQIGGTVPATPDTTFDSITAGGGNGFIGGTASGGDTNTNGNNGARITDPSPGTGAAAPRADLGGGAARSPPGGSGQIGNAGNPYSGGGSGAKSGIGEFANGGGSGAFAEKVWTPADLPPGSIISYAVGMARTPNGDFYLGGAGTDGALFLDWDY